MDQYVLVILALTTFCRGLLEDRWWGEGGRHLLKTRHLVEKGQKYWLCGKGRREPVCADPGAEVYASSTQADCPSGTEPLHL